MTLRAQLIQSHLKIKTRNRINQRIQTIDDSGLHIEGAGNTN